MLEIFGKNYFIDLDEINNRCRTTPIDDENIEGEDEKEEKEVVTINIFKFEILKMCIERVLSEYDDEDGEVGSFAADGTSISFKFAFNTLLKNNIIIEEEYE